jgi:CheY-like chemotaxis protein
MNNEHTAAVRALPFADASKPNAGDASPEADQQKKAKVGGKVIRIIVVDDESLIAETVAEILKQEGFDALAVSSGASAVELARTWTPDVVLSDVVMPGLNGIEIGVKIREISPDCKIILFSGQAATVDLLEEARQSGHRFEILAKPIKPEQLIHVVRSGFTS